MASTRITNLDKVDLDQLPARRNVEGRDIKFVFLLIPMGIPTLEGAVDDALQKGGGDVMTDVVVSQYGWWFLVGETGFVVKGDVINTRGLESK